MYRYVVTAATILAAGLSFVSASANAFTMMLPASACHRLQLDTALVFDKDRWFNKGNQFANQLSVICPLPNDDRISLRNISYMEINGVGRLGVQINSVAWSGQNAIQHYSNGSNNGILYGDNNFQLLPLTVAYPGEIYRYASVIVTMNRNSIFRGILIQTP